MEDGTSRHIKSVATFKLLGPQFNSSYIDSNYYTFRTSKSTMVQISQASFQGIIKNVVFEYISQGILILIFGLIYVAYKVRIPKLKL